MYSFRVQDFSLKNFKSFLFSIKFIDKNEGEQNKKQSETHKKDD